MFNSIKRLFKRAKNPKCRETFRLIQKVEEITNKLFDEKLDGDMTPSEILANCVNGLLYSEALKHHFKKAELLESEINDDLNETNVHFLKTYRNITEH